MGRSLDLNFSHRAGGRVGLFICIKQSSVQFSRRCRDAALSGKFTQRSNSSPNFFCGIPNPFIAQNFFNAYMEMP